MELPGHRAQQITRHVDELECACSVLLAIVLAHAANATNISWAAFSGYMVMRGHVADSLLRGTLRIVGTVLGAGLALGLVPWVRSSLMLCALVAATIGGLALYGALTHHRAYAWLFVGLTFELILFDQLEHPTRALSAFAETRVLEVVAGTAACVFVSACSALTLRRRWPGVRAPTAQRLSWHPQAARHAGQAALALAALPVLWFCFGVPKLAQGAVSILAAMLVPVTSLGASGLVPVSRKLFQRVAGCLAGGMLAGFFLLVGQGSVTWLLAGTVLGVALGRHIENGPHSLGYTGTQFVLGMLVTLVPDLYAGAEIKPALARLTGILVGVGILEPVLIGWHLVAPFREQENNHLPQTKRTG